MREQITEARDQALLLEPALRGAVASEIIDGDDFAGSLLTAAGELADLLCDAFKKSRSSEG